MTDPQPGPSLDDDLKAYHAHGQSLVESARMALPKWCTSVVLQRVGDLTADERAELDSVITDVTTTAEASLQVLVAADPDEPLSGPLDRLRSATPPLHDLLDRLGATPPVRDAMDTQLQPNDRHAIGPMAFADLGPAVHEAGIRWGAAKAHMHLRRRREATG